MLLKCLLALSFVRYSRSWALQVPSRIVQQLRDQIQAALDDANLVPYKELGDADPETVAIWLLEDTVVKLLPSVLKSVFRSVHDDFVARHSKSGTTATVAVVCGREVISANVGDSLAYLDTGTQVLLLSGNHRIDENEAERKRLIEAGGDICQAEFEGEAVGPLRIWPGGLAFSRFVFRPLNCANTLLVFFTEVFHLRTSVAASRTGQARIRVGPSTAALLDHHNSST